jgi:hypothetical protein
LDDKCSGYTAAEAANILGIYPKLERGNQEFSYFTNAFLNDEDAK